MNEFHCNDPTMLALLHCHVELALNVQISLCISEGYVDECGRPVVEFPWLIIDWTSLPHCAYFVELRSSSQKNANLRKTFARFLDGNWVSSLSCTTFDTSSSKPEYTVYAELIKEIHFCTVSELVQCNGKTLRETLASCEVTSPSSNFKPVRQCL